MRRLRERWHQLVDVRQQLAQFDADAAHGVQIPEEENTRRFILGRVSKNCTIYQLVEILERLTRLPKVNPFSTVQKPQEKKILIPRCLRLLHALRQRHDGPDDGGGGLVGGVVGAVEGGGGGGTEVLGRE